MTGEEAIAQLDSLAQYVAERSSIDPDEVSDADLEALGIAIEAIRAKEDKQRKEE